MSRVDVRGSTEHPDLAGAASVINSDAGKSARNVYATLQTHVTDLLGRHHRRRSREVLGVRLVSGRRRPVQRRHYPARQGRSRISTSFCAAPSRSWLSTVEHVGLGEQNITSARRSGSGRIGCRVYDSRYRYRIERVDEGENETNGKTVVYTNDQKQCDVSENGTVGTLNTSEESSSQSEGSDREEVHREESRNKTCAESHERLIVTDSDLNGLEDNGVLVTAEGTIPDAASEDQG